MLVIYKFCTIGTVLNDVILLEPWDISVGQSDTMFGASKHTHDKYFNEQKMKWNEVSMECGWFKVRIKSEQINGYLFSDTNTIK